MNRATERIVRKPVVAGQFYESNPESLKRQVGRFMVSDSAKTDALAVVSPHAGLVYSGAVAGAVYSTINMPDSFLIIGPNHTGLGSPVSVFPGGIWETPLNNFEIDQELTEAILRNCNYCLPDSKAHMFEHSIEVQLPFIAYCSRDVRLSAISVMKASLEECSEIGRSIAEAVRSSGRKIVIAASSDMSHYVSDETARMLDGIALEEIIRMDPAGLYKVVAQKRISMCGVLPVVITLFAARSLGASKSSLIKYSTSAEVSGDYSHVVGYAGLLII